MHIIDIDHLNEQQLVSLQNNSYVDNATKAIELRFVVYSVSLQMYCLTILKFTKNIGDIWAANIKYSVFNGNVSVEAMGFFPMFAQLLFLVYVTNETFSLLHVYFQICPKSIERVCRKYKHRLKKNMELQQTMHKRSQNFKSITDGNFNFHGTFSHTASKTTISSKCSILAFMLVAFFKNIFFLSRIPRLAYVLLSMLIAALGASLYQLSAMLKDELSTTSNLLYYENLERIANISYVFRALFTTAVLISTVILLHHFARFPYTGSNVIAMSNTVMSRSFVSFMGCSSF